MKHLYNTERFRKKQFYIFRNKERKIKREEERGRRKIKGERRRERERERVRDIKGSKEGKYSKTIKKRVRK